jgi:GntR family transcriptional regulator
LPPERKLAARLGATVGTLRKALAARGLPERIQGVQHYVRARPGGQGICGFRLERPKGGGLPLAEGLVPR